MAETFPFQAVATMKYKSAPGTPLMAFAKGDMLTVVSIDDDGDWYEGTTQAGTTGFFPVGFVQRIEVEEQQERIRSPVTAPATVEDATTTAPQVAAAVAAPQAEARAQSDNDKPEPLSAPETVAPTAPPALVPTPNRKPIATSHTSLTSPEGLDATLPPRPAPKSSSLKDRIAALNAVGAGASAPPPIRAKPREFKRTVAPVSPVEPSSTLPSSSPPTANTQDVERGLNASAGLSAEDAIESIGKGGGSLKDRIKALQGVQLDTPAAPGRAPKPWKKKSADVAAPAAPTPEDSVAATNETSVKADKDTADGDDLQDSAISARQCVKAKTVDDGDTPITAPDPTASSTSVSGDGETSDATLLGKSHAQGDSSGTSDWSTAATRSAATAEGDATAPTPPAIDEDAEKRAAIAERMAGLGGQRVGISMPPLPKRAGPPRRKAAASATSAFADAASTEESASGPRDAAEQAISPLTEQIEAKNYKNAPVVTLPNVDEPRTDNPVIARATSDKSQEPADLSGVSKDEGELKAAIQTNDEDEIAAPATLGVGASSLLMRSVAQDDDDDDADSDNDNAGAGSGDFDTPSLPSVAPARSLPKAPSAPDAEGDVEADEQSVGPSALPLRPEVAIGEDAAPAAEDETAAFRPDVPASEERQTPTAPATSSRPAIPAIPTSFRAASAPPEKPAIVIPRSSEGEDRSAEVRASPSSPATSARPAIPAAFAVTPSPAAEDGDGERDEAHADASTSPPVRLLPVLPVPDRRPFVSPPIGTADECAQTGDAEEVVEDDEETDDEDDEEEEEEDPEVARRAALAARMARLGGMNMRMGMGPMIPPIGGVRAPAVKKKKKKVKQVAEAEGSVVDEGAAPDGSVAGAGSPPTLEDRTDNSTSFSYVGGMPRGGVALPGIGPPSSVQPPVNAEQFEESQQEPQEQEQDAPAVNDRAESDNLQTAPALPPGRPLPMPLRRSVPVPFKETADEGLAVGVPRVDDDRFVDEPENVEMGGEQTAEAPPPPSRPPGGLPPIPNLAKSPEAPKDMEEFASPSRRASSKRDSVTSLERVTTRSSVGSRSVTRGASLEYARDAPVASMAPLPESAYSRGELQEASMTLGAQMFAAAHTKLSDKGSRAGTDLELVGFCFERARGAQRMADGSYGTVVWGLEASGKGKSGQATLELDEPRAGDVIVFTECKFKATLSTTRVGADGRPKLAIVAAWDAKKRKLKTIEVGKDGAVDEGSYKMDDLKEGQVKVQRVVVAGFQAQ